MSIDKKGEGSKVSTKKIVPPNVWDHLTLMFRFAEDINWYPV